MAGLNIPLILRKDVSANWTSVNPILLDGQEGWEKDTNKKKIGDGVTAWNDLDYFVGSSTAADTSFDPTTLFDPSITDVQAMGDDLKTKVDAALTKTFAPWQPEVIEGSAGVELLVPVTIRGDLSLIDNGTAVHVVSTPTETQWGTYYYGEGAYANAYAPPDKIALIVKASISGAHDSGSFARNSGFGHFDTASSWWSALITSVWSWTDGELKLDRLGDTEGTSNDYASTGSADPLAYKVMTWEDAQSAELGLVIDKSLGDNGSVLAFVNGEHLYTYAFTTDVLTQCDQFFVAAWYSKQDTSATTKAVSEPVYPITGYPHVTIGEGGSGASIDETKYPQNPEGKGYEIIGLAQPVQWDELGKEVKSGDFIVFDNDGLPKTLGEDVDLSVYLTKTFAPWQPETSHVVGNIYSDDSDIDGQLVSSLDGDSVSAYYVLAEAEPLLLCFTLSNPTANAVIHLDYSVDQGQTWQMSGYGEIECQGDIVFFGASHYLGAISMEPGDEVFISYAREEGSVGRNILLINGVEVARTTYPMSLQTHIRLRVEDAGNSPAFTLIEKPSVNPYNDVVPYRVDGTVIDETKYPQNNLGRGYEIIGLSSQTQWNELGKEVKNGDFIVFNNAGIPVLMNEEPTVVQEAGNSETAVMSQKATTDALGGKVDKIQTKEILTANKTLTAADSGKLLIINADGITITMPTNSEFNIDIAKMDEDFITVVQCVGTDKFREDAAAITVIRDVSITNSGIAGKEWLAIGAYEA